MAHDWDKGEPEVDYRQILRDAMRQLGFTTAQVVFDDEIGKMRQEVEEAERKRVEADHQRKVDSLAEARATVARLEYELGYRQTPTKTVGARVVCVCNDYGPTNCPAHT